MNVVVAVKQFKMMAKSRFVFITFFVGTFSLAVSIPQVQAVNANANLQNNRIVGGTVATNGSTPYMAALSTGWIFRSFVCGGSLISERYVLTAAHCVEALYNSGTLRRSLRVTVGTNRWNRGGQVYSVSHNLTHKEYQPSIIKNDIGLLVTKTKVQLSQLVAPVKLSFEFVNAGVAARAAGWGRTKYMGPISNNLLELKVNTIDGQQCVDQVASVSGELGIVAPPVDPKVELCTLHSPAHGMCNGDSGSALVRLDSSEQIGVVSWGLPCARGAPDVFLRISAFKDWLQKNFNAQLLAI